MFMVGCFYSMPIQLFMTCNVFYVTVCYAYNSNLFDFNFLEILTLGKVVSLMFFIALVFH